MRKTLQLLLATALAVLVAFPAPAADASSQIVTLSGVLSSVHEDRLGSNGERDLHFLTVGDQQYTLEFAARAQAPEGQTGAEVTVTGRLAGHTLVVGTGKSDFKIRKQGPVSLVTSGSTTTTSSGTTTSPSVSSGGATAAARIAAVLINFSDLATKPYTTSQVASALYSSSTSAAAFYQEESKGSMTVSGAVFGWYTIDSTTTGCNWTDWITKGTAAANAAGANLSSFTNVMFIFPNTSQCGFAGLGYVPGTVTMLNGTISVQVMTHELGHNFGLAHANAINCVVNGTRVSLSSAANCTEVVYADPFSTMGNNALRHNQGSQLGELGFLADSEKVVGAPGNTYTITPYFSSGGVHLVRIPRGDGSYFDLDFRMTYGVFDDFAAGSPAVSGVTIRLGWGTASPTNNPHATQLIDTTPSTSSWADAPLLVGKTFTDPVSTISFTTMSVSAGSAVQVRVREGIAPSAPSSLTATPAADGSSVALAWGAATDNVAVASYRIARNGTALATVAAGTLSFADTGTKAGASYTYTVTAVDTSGNAGPAASVAVSTPGGASVTSTAVDTQPPTAPEPFTGTAAATTVSLTWGASTDNTGVADYVVTRNGTQVSTVTGTSWTDTGRTPDTTYSYTVSAVDTSHNKSAASQLQVTTTADISNPWTPNHFRRVRQSGRYVTFAWSPSRDNVGVWRYLVYMVGHRGPIAHTSSTSIKFRTIRGHRYYIRAEDAAGNLSGMSRWVRITY